MKHYITINKKYNNESTALERSAMNCCGGVGEEEVGGEGELKLALREAGTEGCIQYRKLHCYIWKSKRIAFGNKEHTKIPKIGDSVWLSFFICKTVLCEATYAP